MTQNDFLFNHYGNKVKTFNNSEIIIKMSYDKNIKIRSDISIMHKPQKCLVRNDKIIIEGIAFIWNDKVQNDNHIYCIEVYFEDIYFWEHCNYHQMAAKTTMTFKNAW